MAGAAETNTSRLAASSVAVWKSADAVAAAAATLHDASLAVSLPLVFLGLFAGAGAPAPAAVVVVASVAALFRAMDCANAASTVPASATSLVKRSNAADLTGRDNTDADDVDDDEPVVGFDVAAELRDSSSRCSRALPTPYSLRMKRRSAASSSNPCARTSSTCTASLA